MTVPRPALAALTGSLVALLLIAPTATADLAVDTRSGPGYDIYTHGSSTLSAPQNTTIQSAYNGYVIDWTAPQALAGQQVTGYVLYRVPGPSTPGTTQVTHLSPRWTVTYDRPGDGTYIYFVTALFSAPASAQAESVPGNPVSSADVRTNYPHCNVVGIYFAPPYYDTHIDCLFPLA